MLHNIVFLFQCIAATEIWEKLTFVSNQPMPRAQTTAFIFSKFTSRGNVHYMGLPEQDYFGSKPEPAFQEKQPLGNSARASLAEAKKYTFAKADSCMEEMENNFQVSNVN